MNRTKRSPVAIVQMTVVAVVIAACRQDVPTSPRFDQPIDLMVLSDTAAIRGVASGQSRAAFGSLPEMSYVSLPPGSISGGESAVISNRRTAMSVIAPLVDGGFDPVPIGASAGDTIDIAVSHMHDAPTLLVSVVPERRPPTIVRTIPPRGKKDVPLNARLIVVFSEPIDKQTVTAESIQLRFGNMPLAGRIEIAADGIVVTFAPNEPLAASNAYSLRIGTGIRDLDGERLADPAVVEFTTGLVAASAAEIAYTAEVDGNSDIYLTGGVGAGSTRLTSHVSPDREPAWSPDASHIAFTSERDGNAEIYVMNADGGDVVRVTNHPAPDSHPSWSPDGSSIAFVSKRDDNAEIYVARVDGSNATRLTSEAGRDESPAWSPDGTKIAFASDRDGTSHIYVMKVDGSNVVRLTTSPEAETDPAWSPDGGRVAFGRFQSSTSCVPVEEIDTGTDLFGYERMCRRDIVIVNADGSGAVRLDLPTAPTNPPDDWWRSVFLASDPTWSPDGRDVAAAVFYCLSDLGGADCHSENAIVVLSSAGVGGFVELTKGSVSVQSPKLLSNPAWPSERD